LQECWQSDRRFLGRQCPALVHLGLRDNGVNWYEHGSIKKPSLYFLTILQALSPLNLCGNQVGDAGAESFAGVLGQCTAWAQWQWYRSCRWHRFFREREAWAFVAWSSLWSSFIGTLHCLLFDICSSLNKRHDLYLIASLWVVATQVRASLTIFESFVLKRKRGESERWL
jgi:hypothetical protein